MNAQELAAALRIAYETAPQQDKSLHVTLFGIQYAEQLDQFIAQDICSIAGVGKWGPQLNLAKKLSRYVVLKH